MREVEWRSVGEVVGGDQHYKHHENYHDCYCFSCDVLLHRMRGRVYEASPLKTRLLLHWVPMAHSGGSASPNSDHSELKLIRPIRAAPRPTLIATDAYHSGGLHGPALIAYA